MISDDDIRYLKRCVELAAEAVDAGDAPFGSVLVSSDGRMLAEDRNRINSLKDGTRHPEFALARWATENLSPDERRSATVYTSGEHCPMCAAAHGWVGLGRIVYASSSAQLSAWQSEFGAAPSRVKRIAVEEVVQDIVVDGPASDFADEIRALHGRHLRMAASLPGA